MARPRGTFAAVPSKAMHSPALNNLRRMHSPTADVYYFRALLFCKEYEKTGLLCRRWDELAAYLLWPNEPADLCALFRSSGTVVGEKDELVFWDEFNGFLIRRADEDAARHRRLRIRAKQAARTRKAKAKAAAAGSPQEKRLQKGRWVGSGGMTSADRPRTSADAEKEQSAGAARREPDAIASPKAASGRGKVRRRPAGAAA